MPTNLQLQPRGALFEGVRRYRYVVTTPVFTFTGSQLRKLFEINPRKPQNNPTDVLLFGPSGCAARKKLKYIWYAANPGKQTSCRAADVYSLLEQNELLSSFTRCEKEALQAFIKTQYLDIQRKGPNWTVWVTELVNTESVPPRELTSEIVEGLPNSSLLWPFLKIPEGDVPEWLASLCVGVRSVAVPLPRPG